MPPQPTKTRSAAAAQAQAEFHIDKTAQYHVNAVSMRFTLHAGQFLKEHGLSAASWRVMAMLAEHEPLSAKQVTELTVMNAYRVTRAIAALEGLGLATRDFDDKDRRRIELRLTPKGHRVHGKILPHLSTAIGDLYSVLTPAEYDQLRAMLLKLQRRSIELFGAVPVGTSDGD